MYWTLISDPYSNKVHVVWTLKGDNAKHIGAKKRMVDETNKYVYRWNQF